MCFIAWGSFIAPVITGRIAWARQLYRRLAAPMDVFQQFDALLKSPDAIKVVKGYNRMARVLVEYEVLHHQAWTQQVFVLKSMSSSIPGGRETFVMIASTMHVIVVLHYYISFIVSEVLAHNYFISWRLPWKQ